MVHVPQMCVVFCYNIALDVELITFFIWKKNLSFLRYLGFCVFVKSIDIKICDLIIDISLQKPLRIMEPERCSNMKKHLLCVEFKKGLIESTNFHKFSFIHKVLYIYTFQLYQNISIFTLYTEDSLKVISATKQ